MEKNDFFCRGFDTHVILSCFNVMADAESQPPLTESFSTNYVFFRNCVENSASKRNGMVVRLSISIKKERGERNERI